MPSVCDRASHGQQRLTPQLSHLKTALIRLTREIDAFTNNLYCYSPVILNLPSIFSEFSWESGLRIWKLIGSRERPLMRIKHSANHRIGFETAVGVCLAFLKSWQSMASSEKAVNGWTEHFKRWLPVAYSQLAQGMRCSWRTFAMPRWMFLYKLQTVSKTVLHKNTKHTAGITGRIQTMSLASIKKLNRIIWSTKKRKP